jgi:hypothetical protein
MKIYLHFLLELSSNSWFFFPSFSWIVIVTLAGKFIWLLWIRFSWRSRNSLRIFPFWRIIKFKNWVDFSFYPIGSCSIVGFRFSKGCSSCSQWRYSFHFKAEVIAEANVWLEYEVWWPAQRIRMMRCKSKYRSCHGVPEVPMWFVFFVFRIFTTGFEAENYILALLVHEMVSIKWSK